jgi:hypothetical protein
MQRGRQRVKMERRCTTRTRGGARRSCQTSRTALPRSPIQAVNQAGSAWYVHANMHTAARPLARRARMPRPPAHALRPRSLACLSLVFVAPALARVSLFFPSPTTSLMSSLTVRAGCQIDNTARDWDELSDSLFASSLLSMAEAIDPTSDPRILENLLRAVTKAIDHALDFRRAAFKDAFVERPSVLLSAIVMSISAAIEVAGVHLVRLSLLCCPPPLCYPPPLLSSCTVTIERCCECCR